MRSIKIESKDIIILILIIVLVALLGFIFIESVQKPEETALEKDLGTEKITKEYCIELAWESEERYKNCMNLILTELYDYGEGACEGELKGREEALFCEQSIKACRYNFPNPMEVFSNCLRYVE